jgi:hypothetical protein
MLQNLDNSLWPNKFPVIAEHPKNVLTVIFKTLPRSENTPQATPSQPAVNQLKAEPMATIGAKKNTRAARETTFEREVQAPGKIVEKPTKSAHPPLDLSKVLSDTKQVAKEIYERSEARQTINRRKLQVNPENLKSPDITPKEQEDAYKLPNRWDRICKKDASGKKTCWSKMPDDPDTPFNANIYMQDYVTPDKKPGEELGKRFQEAIDKRGPDDN